MNTCPHCGLGTLDEEFCPDCGVRTGACTRDHRPPPGTRMLRRSVVYRAPDDVAAITIRKVLEAEGIEAWVESSPTHGLDALAGTGDGFWGMVRVYEDQEADAVRSIERYLVSLSGGPQ